MSVLNVHERVLEADPAQVGRLIDTLASRRDRLWPKHAWPPMELDRPLGVGAVGGHGPIRYFVEEYAPGTAVTFRFTGPKGLAGHHAYQVLGGLEHGVVLRHTVKMHTHGRARLSWPLLYGPLHDALMEDSLATAQASLGLTAELTPWSRWVKFLRWAFSGGKARPQTPPGPSPLA